MKIIISISLLLISNLIFSQDHRFGKVSKEELSKERSTIDPESPAEILYEKIDIVLDYSRTEGRFFLTKEVEGRIKIYSKDNTADKYLKQEISLYSPNSNREKISGLRGVTYNMDEGKIIETKVKSSDIFTEKVNKYWEVEKLTFANVKDGSVLEYKYTITSPFYREIDRWYFQQEIPVLSSSLKFYHPEFMIYSPDERGEIRGKTNKTTKPTASANYNTQITEYLFTNVKPLKKEPFVFNSNNLKASVRFEMMMLSHPGIITENYSATWQQIGKDLNDHEKIGRQLKGNSFLDETVKIIAENTSDKLQKTQAIFNYVKDNFTWNNYHSMYTDNGIRQTFKDKTGNAADINLMLISMLQKAGVNANPVVLSTVNNLMLNYSFPSVTSLNFLIAGAEINGKLYLMDATEKMSKINMLPLRDLNHRGFMISNNGNIQEISLTNYSLSSSKEIIGITLNSDGTISGSYSETRDEYLAMSDNMRRKENPKEFQSDYLSNFAFDVDTFKVDENNERGIVRYSLKFDNVPAGEVIGNKILVNPLLFSQLKKNSFQYETRNYPLEFGSAMSRSKTVRIKIPEGYKVESLPQEKQFVIEGDHAGYVYKVIEKDGYIEAVTLYQVNQSILPASYYKPMKDLENQQINAENQQVILVKL